MYLYKFKDNTRAMFELEAVMRTGTYIYMVIQEIMVIQGYSLKVVVTFIWWASRPKCYQKSKVKRNNRTTILKYSRIKMYVFLHHTCLPTRISRTLYSIQYRSVSSVEGSCTRVRWVGIRAEFFFASVQYARYCIISLTVLGTISRYIRPLVTQYSVRSSLHSTYVLCK